MRIGIVVTQSEQGGVQVFLSQFMLWLKSQNHEVAVFAGSEGWLAERCHEAGIPFTLLKHLKREINPLQDLLAIREMRYALRAFKPDAVHINSTKAGIIASIAARLAYIPRITYRIGGWVFLEELPTWKKLLYKNLEKLTARFKDVIICVHPGDVEIAKTIGIKPKLRLISAPNGIDMPDFTSKLFSKNEARKQLSLSEAFIFGTIANFYPAKNLPRYIEACAITAAQIPNAHFVIIGDGDERHALETAIHDHRLEGRVTLIGARKDADQLFLAFDAFVLPSSKEGMSWALLRAMAAGLPCIATDVGAARWMLEPNAGLIVQVNDTIKLAEAMTGIANDVVSRSTLGQNAKEAAQNRFPLEQTFAENASALFN